MGESGFSTSKRLIRFSTCLVFIPLLAEATPVPDIEANGRDDTVSVVQGAVLEIAVALDEGIHSGEPVDWWIVAEASSGKYWYTASGEWVESTSPIPSHIGPLTTLAPRVVLSNSDLPVGEYRFSFAVDDNQDGILDAHHLDQVQVNIEARSLNSPLNDTGITTCSDDTGNGLPCPVVDHPGQDAEFGRDVTHNDPTDGHAGFSFIKIDNNGNDLPSSAAEWFCVKDNVTGLIWEVKTDDGGLRDKDNTYTWYNPDMNVNGGDPGWQDGGVCVGSSCDTKGYVDAVNMQGLCGAANWRMPTIKELENIRRLDRSNPAIDTSFFPKTVSLSYWSGSPAASYVYHAWRVYFHDGLSYYGHKKYGEKYVRLVHE